MTYSSHNVTIDALDFATPVDDPEIAEVIDLISGEVLRATTFIASHRYDEFVKVMRVAMREAMKKGKPRHVCALCSTPVHLVGNKQKRFFFRHKIEDGSCPAVTRSVLSEEEIRARKYHGLRESDAHKRIKGLIERSLRADPSFDTESIVQEKRWNAADDPKTWRKPDVQATSVQGRFAFEAQLSTTFLDVVVSRRMFYRDVGAHLIWVLANFSEDYRRMTTDDLLFSNNSNVFVVDQETVRLSEETKQFHLRCHYRIPFDDAGTIRDKWQETIVPFSAVKKEIEQQRAYFFDYEAEEAKISDRLLRDEVIAYWAENMTRQREGSPDHQDRWLALKKNLAARNIAVPDRPAWDSGFRGMMHAVLSALKGYGVGWQFDTLIQCAHQTAQVHPESMLAFGFAVEVAGHKELLKSQDSTGKWASRCEVMRSQLRKGDPKYTPPQEWMPALSFLFPEVGARLAEFVRRNSMPTG
ncbi:DUF6035 family protein [Bradyrhizobium sp. ERR14]|uniref:DUF6035 family protein n=1 Tax=Bradyrhizobium sp. ERR14 TaxID=2663837 RepID=UPI00160912EC|nr:DUF6035 family protein [Bradyrhizobium sp. ERR14]MBB4395073.1 hypothetical protein [Bradyrhizobium sp. ERR14]